MSSDLISIARSGLGAARLGLDVTSQNIANINTPGYVRRSIALEEVVSTSATGGLTANGVRLSGIVRNASAFDTAEVRRTASDLARADAELRPLQGLEDAIEQSGIGTSLSNFEAALSQLSANPADPALRGVALESADAVAQGFNRAATAMDSQALALTNDATGQAAELQRLGEDLVKVNAKIVRVGDGTMQQAALMDERDQLLEKMSGIAGISVTIGPRQTAEVHLGSAAGATLVGPNGSATVSSVVTGTGRLALDVGGTVVQPTTGSFAGLDAAYTAINDAHDTLDAMAGAFASAVNSAQAAGTDLNGQPGAALFSGTDAGSLTLTATSGSAIAAASAGAAAGSRDGGNLANLGDALDTPAVAFDALLSGISSAVAGRTATRDTLSTIADSAATARDNRSAVSLDEEAANLIRYQQAFDASSRVIQVARDIFDSIIAIR